MMETSFEWDPEKALLNVRKHRVTFETAIRVFLDPYAVIEQDRIVDGEERWQIIGIVDGKMMLMVAHSIEEHEHLEVIRIISARRANRGEEQRYEDENG